MKQAYWVKISKKKSLAFMRGSARDLNRERQYLVESVCVCLHLHKFPSSFKIAKLPYSFTKVYKGDAVPCDPCKGGNSFPPLEPLTKSRGLGQRELFWEGDISSPACFVEKKRTGLSRKNECGK
jgi:hypothetical protein